MKKSEEILGLPIISITEGRELGMSKTLLINAHEGKVAAITIEDADWYRGVKLIPYESVIAIGDDAVTITNSENILTLEDAGDYETLLDENIRVIGTKAITKTGTIQGKITELFIGDDGKIEKCEITAPDGTTSEITNDQISIFGKEVTVIDANIEKKTVTAPAAEAPKPAAKPEPAKPEPKKETPAPAPAPKPAAKPVEPEVKPEPPKAEPAPAKPEPKKEVPKAEPAPQPAKDPKQAAADKATEERHRRFLLGKKAARTIKTDNGVTIVEAGADITEEVLQKAKLANKFIELSMNVQ
jgi:uncharacterized protein YrrD